MLISSQQSCTTLSWEYQLAAYAIELMRGFRIAPRVGGVYLSQAYPQRSRAPRKIRKSLRWRNYIAASTLKEAWAISSASSTEDAFSSLALSTEGWLLASLGSNWNS